MFRGRSRWLVALGVSLASAALLTAAIASATCGAGEGSGGIRLTGATGSYTVGSTVEITVENTSSSTIKTQEDWVGNTSVLSLTSSCKEKDLFAGGSCIAKVKCLSAGETYYTINYPIGQFATVYVKCI
jgi:hypothetical protein